MSIVTEISRCVAIVGRPNVGKSRLFNRLVGRRVSIVHDMPGVTRDLICEEVRDGAYTLMDTGGIGLLSELTPKVIADAIEEQVEFAINAAKVILLVVDVNEGCTPLDIEIAAKLRRFGKQVVVVANKADNEKRAANQGDFFTLNHGTPILVSAEHGTGVAFLIERIKNLLGPVPVADEAEGAGADSAADGPVIRLCLAGRPNVGKSSIGNRLLKSERLIVSEMPGTTRDPVRVRLDYETDDGAKWPFELVDTAGRRATTRHDVLDYYSELRSDAALDQADVAFIILDAAEGVTRMDKQLAGRLIERGTGVVVVVNKWDIATRRFAAGGEGLRGYSDEADFRAKYVEAVRAELFFLPDSPVLFVSAKEGLDVGKVLAAARAVYQRATTQLTTGRLNKAIHDLMERQPPRMLSGRRFKCYYAVQVSARPLRVRLFCNSKERVEANYERYLLAGIYEAFELGGVPVQLEFVGKPKDPTRQFFSEQQPAVGTAQHRAAKQHGALRPAKQKPRRDAKGGQGPKRGAGGKGGPRPKRGPGAPKSGRRTGGGGPRRTKKS